MPLARVDARLYLPERHEVDPDEGMRIFAEVERDEGCSSKVAINAFTAAGEGAIAQITLGREAGISLLAQLAAALAFPE